MNNRTIKRAFYIVILFIFSCIADAQVISQHKTDSLKNLLPGSDACEQVDILNELGSIYAPVNFDSSIYYSARAMRIATIYNYSYGIGCSRLFTGNAYYYKMDFKNGLVSYLSAQKILEEIDSWEELAELNAMLGHINFFIMRPEKAISYYHRAIEYYLSAGDEESLPAIFHALGLTFWREGLIDSAAVYINKLLQYSKRHYDLPLEANALTLFGQIYNDERAIAYDNEALKIAMKLNNDNSISILYNNMASLYDRSSTLFEIYGDLKLSRSYYEKGYQAASKLDYSILQAMIPVYIAQIDIEEGKYNQAEVNLDLCEAKLKGFYLHPEMNTSPLKFYSFGKIFDFYLLLRTKNDLYHTRYRLALAKGEFYKAVAYLQQFYQSQDTLNSAQQGRQFELLIAEAEAERTDQKIRALAQENELKQLQLIQSRFVFAGIAAVVVIISLFMLLFFQRKRLKAEQKSIVMEQRLLRAQMNPHFLFNSLASIQNYIINEKTDQASIYLSRFSQLVRDILDNSVEEFVPLEKEIETVKNYLELQKVRYAGKFDFKIEMAEEIDEENMMIPPMLAQPFIENSIEHGVKYRETLGHIEVRFCLEDGLIRVEVEDDGVGRTKAHEIEMNRKIKHRSMATSITHDRLKLINKKLKRKIQLEIIDLKDASGAGCGTKVRFGIPVVLR